MGRILSLRETWRFQARLTYTVFVDAVASLFQGQQPDLSWIGQRQVPRPPVSLTMFRPLQYQSAAEACQARTEDACDGYAVLRLIAGFVLFHTSRVIFKWDVTTVAMVDTLQHHWMTVDYEPFEIYAIAQYFTWKPASILDKASRREGVLLLTRDKLSFIL